MNVLGTIRWLCCALALAGLGHHAGGAEQDSAPAPTIIIPSAPDVPTAHAWVAAIKAYNHATLTGVWAGKRPPVAPDQVLAFLSLFERACDGDARVTLASLRAAAQEALDHQSSDAMVLYGLARYATGKPDERLHLMRDAARALNLSPYPANRSAIAWLRVVMIDVAEHGRVDPGEADQAIARLVAWLKSLPAEEVGALPALDEVFRGAFLDERVLDHGVGDRLLAALADPSVPAWWSETLRGRVHIQLAWMARGCGWADTVTPAGWKGMAEHLAQARTLLTSAWNRRHDRSMPASAMITVAMGGDTQAGDCLAWFEKAVSAQMDDGEAYDGLNTALMPRWGGSHEAMLALGNAAAATKRYDTRVPWRLIVQVEAIWSDAHELSELRPTILDAGVYARCGAVLDGYMAVRDRAAQESNRAYYASVRAVLAFMCGLNGEGLHQLDAIKGHELPSAFRVLGMTAQQLRAAANAAETPGQVPPAAPRSPAGAPADVPQM